jgi:tRNA threonylcarbamoyladenosine biosynthesis protein TsaB
VWVLAFDTATTVATIALVGDSESVLGERTSRAVELLEDADELLGQAGLDRAAIEGIAVGTGPGSYTGLRMGLVTARTLALALDIQVAGISTLAALAAGAPGAAPVIDGRRSEVFALQDGLPVVRPAKELEIDRGRTYVGDGAVRYRDLLEERGAVVPADDDPVHIPWARHHVRLAREYGAPELAEPIYLRLPDAERALSR